MERVKEKYLKGELDLFHYKRKAAILTVRLLKVIYNFKHLKVIAEGSFSNIITMKCPDTKQTVVAKIVLESRVTKYQSDLWPMLEHQNLVPLIRCESILLAHTYVFVMPKFSTTLEKQLQKPSFVLSKRSLIKTISWLQDIMKGLEYLHDHSLCHLSLMLSNILISESGKAAICDFDSLASTMEPVTRLVRNSF